MQKLELYYRHYFGSSARPDNKHEFVTRLTDWRSQFPTTHGLSSFALRILKALLLNQKVVIFADYDTDAVSATSVLYWGLIGMGFAKDALAYYAPDRFTESYGINQAALDTLVLSYDLIITVDCGSNSLEEIKSLEGRRADILVTDHHVIQAGLPEATAFINPQYPIFASTHATKRWTKQQVSKEEKTLLSLRNYLSPENYVSWLPKGSTSLWSTSLVGAGVVWMSLVYTSYWLQDLLDSKVLTGVPATILTRIRKWTPRKLESLLSFVAIATIADCQSIADPLNRSLVHAGLKYLNSDTIPYPGLAELLDQTGFITSQLSGYVLNSQDIGFVLSPILNAAGRVSHAHHAIGAMLSWDSEEAAPLVSHLLALNQTRKELVQHALKEVEAECAKQLKSASVVVIKGKWSKGIVGLIASRITSQYGVPAFVINTDGDVWSGSARAPEGYHLVDILTSVSEMLVAFGGHSQAAGFRLQSDQWKLFYKEMHAYINSHPVVISHKKWDTLIGVSSLTADVLTLLDRLSLTHLSPEHCIYLDPRDMTENFSKKLWGLDPFGEGFPMPLIITRLQAGDYGYRMIGKDNNHVKITQENLVMTKFYLTESEKQCLVKKQELLLVCKSNINVFRGTIRYEWIVEKMIVV